MLLHGLIMHSNAFWFVQMVRTKMALSVFLVYLLAIYAVHLLSALVVFRVFTSRIILALSQIFVLVEHTRIILFFIVQYVNHHVWHVLSYNQTALPVLLQQYTSTTNVSFHVLFSCTIVPAFALIASSHAEIVQLQLLVWVVLLDISLILLAWGRRGVPTVLILNQVIIHALFVHFHAQVVPQSQLALLVLVLSIIITLPVSAHALILPLLMVLFVRRARLLAKLVVDLSLIVLHAKLDSIFITIPVCLDALLEPTIILMLVPFVKPHVLLVVTILSVLLAVELCIWLIVNA